MSHKQFIVSDTNPNDTAGGGGCICDPRKQTDCKPPFVVFYGNEMDSYNSPHVVACKSCIEAASLALDGEILSAGEHSPVSDTPLPDPKTARRAAADLVPALVARAAATVERPPVTEVTLRDRTTDDAPEV